MRKSESPSLYLLPGEVKKLLRDLHNTLKSRIPRGLPQMLCQRTLPTSHLRPPLIIRAGNMLTDAHSSTESQRTHWTPFLLMLLYHTFSTQLWGQNSLLRIPVSLTTQLETTMAIYLLHQTHWSRESFCFQRILGLPLGSLCFTLK